MHVQSWLAHSCLAVGCSKMLHIQTIVRHIFSLTWASSSLPFAKAQGFTGKTDNFNALLPSAQANTCTEVLQSKVANEDNMSLQKRSPQSHILCCQQARGTQFGVEPCTIVLLQTCSAANYLSKSVRLVRDRNGPRAVHHLPLPHLPMFLQTSISVDMQLCRDETCLAHT